ncbi:MAG: hypothetical protein M1837_001764 [Sclerophora amabilis]|nr:MAG: hypothetical protein M1837_001764 [Sclerophora amabilis]
MDAKPQRPVRPARVRADENAPVEVNKIIHQRFKSTGALPSTINGGTLKGAAKRTAFGDVSNTVRTTQPSKDDSVMPGKPVVDVVEKPVTTLVEKKAANLLRPAQRPLSVAGIRGLLTSASMTNTASTASVRPNGTDPQSEQQQTNTRKTLTKSKTTIFKDSVVSDKAFTSLEKNPEVLPYTAPVHQTLVAQPKVLQHVHPEPPVCQRNQVTLDGKVVETKEGACPVTAMSEEHAERGTHKVDDKHPVLESRESSDDFVEARESVDSEGPIRELSQLEQSQLVLDQVVEVRDRILDQTKQKGTQLGELPPVSETNEPEEYWEDEEDEDNYDEEGYTTARSFRSRGENTTGGATTILFPKVTAKVRKEILAAQQIVDLSRTVEEIEDESWDTSMVAEYGEEIFQYMRDLEIKMLPNAHYMDNQAEIQWSMRSVLMDWLIQVHHRFSLLPETLFLCVNYIDRFLSCKIVSLGKLQLVGATAIFVAAKYEEINCPSVQEIVYMVDGGYTVDEILKAERFMLSMLQFELGWPGPMSFLRRISKADDYDLETRTLAKYFLEVTIMDERFVGSPPSFTAAGAHCLARLMLKKGDWSPAHVYYSNYTYSQLRPLLHMMVECCENPSKHHAAVYDKYSDRRFKRASIFTANEMLKGFKLPEAPSRTSNTSFAGLHELSTSKRDSHKRSDHS